MENIKVLVIEDDQFTSRLVDLIITKHFPGMTVVARCGSVSKAIGLTREFNPDLVILDIQLDDGTAFEFLDQIKPVNFKVLFMSSFQAYIEEAVQFAAIDFVKKPFDEEDFILALDKAVEALSDSTYESRLDVLFSNLESVPGGRTLIIPAGEGNRAIPIGEIEYGEAITGGALFFLSSGEQLRTEYPLRRFEVLLSRSGFYRSHPRYLINMALIDKVNRPGCQVTFVSGNTVPLEERRAEVFIARYQQLTQARGAWVAG